MLRMVQMQYKHVNKICYLSLVLLTRTTQNPSPYFGLGHQRILYILKAFLNES